MTSTSSKNKKKASGSAGKGKGKGMGKKQTSVAKQRSGSNWVFLAVIAAVVVGGVIAIVVASSSKNEAENTPTGSVATTAPAQRQAAPALSGTDMITGDQVDLADMKGKPTLVAAWAHWCPHCQKEIPVIQEVYEANKDKYNFATFSTAVGKNPAPEQFADPETFIETTGLAAPTLDDTSGSLSQAWGVQGFPQIWVLDSQGRIAVKASGEQGKEKLLSMLNSVQ